jgi:hypothetical protein
MCHKKRSIYTLELKFSVSHYPINLQQEQKTRHTNEQLVPAINSHYINDIAKRYWKQQTEIA